MAFMKINIEDIIEQERTKDIQFDKYWCSSRMEYKILGDIVKIRKIWNYTKRVSYEDRL